MTQDVDGCRIALIRASENQGRLQFLRLIPKLRDEFLDQFYSAMGSVGIDRLKTQPSPLLKQLGDGIYKDLESYWEHLTSDWDADSAYTQICAAVQKCEEHAQKTATGGAEASLQDQLEEFLGHDSNKLQLEPRKIQLLTAVMQEFLKHDKKAKKSKLVGKQLGISIRIVKTICHLHPKIAFKACPGEDDMGKPIELQSAFQYALASKSEPMLQIILNKLLESLERESGTHSEPGAQESQSQEVNGDGKIISQAAGEKYSSDVVQLLLTTFASLSEDVREKVMNIFKLTVSKNKSLLNESTWKTAVKTPSPEMVQYLLLEIEDSMFQTEDNAAFVVENGTVVMWNMFPEKSRRQFLTKKNSNLLHKAVSLGKADMVEAFLKLEPTQVEATVEESEHEYPLQHLKKLKLNRDIDESGASYNRIRNLLVHAMIRSSNLGIQKIRDILKNSKVTAVEMSYHFPQFKSDANNENSANYIKGLRAMNAKFVRFENVLKYATFPELSGQASFMGSEDLKQDHREVNEVFDWLKGRGVKEIMNLSVEDRLLCPHSDQDVTHCVNAFNVKVLKWRKLDIYLGDIKGDYIEELHLYSSGNRSVHDQWVAQLPKFKQLKRLYVYVVKDVLSSRRVDQVRLQLQNDLKTLQEKPGYPWTGDEEDSGAIPDGDSKTKDETKVETKVETKDGNKVETKDETKVETTVDNKVENQVENKAENKVENKATINVIQMQWLQQREHVIYRGWDNISSDLVGPHLATFIKRFCAYYMECEEQNKPLPKKTKVALIDSGVVVVGGGRSESNNKDALGGDLAQRIVEGISLVSRDNEEHTWWHATEPHGTQMATLICSINPLCDLYVVKVAESNASGITGHNVAKAIEWARLKGVDVISLSLVVFSDPKSEMYHAINLAIQDDIIITCSTADEGSIGAHSVGEKNDEVLKIAACDRWGNLLLQSQKAGFNYQFIGQNIHVGQVPYLDSAESIEGSSVSTAIAAGMASLVLACARISSTFRSEEFDKENHRLPWKRNAVKTRFNRMKERKDGKWVILDRLCDKGQLEKPYEFKRLVDKSFTEASFKEVDN